MNNLFSNYNYDIIIIGGGITGVFLTYKLAETGLKIILFETENKLGGRINTIKENNIQFEAGAARIHISHSKVLTLIDELGLSNDKYKLPEKIDTILRTNKNETSSYNTSINLNLKELLNKSYELSKTLKKEELLNISYEQYLSNIYDFETSQFIKHSFGYDSEFESMNAYTALLMFKDDFFKNDDYYGLKGGLSQIINTMENKLNEKPNVIIKLNCSIKEIANKHIITDKNTKFTFNYLISTIPSNKLKNIDFFNDKLELLKSVKSIPLLRIYLKYNEVWFRNIIRTTTDNNLRHIIPIDYDNGLIMLSYTDGKYATMWNNCHSNGDDYLIEQLHKQIYDLYKINPPKPEAIYVHYWNSGFHTWLPGYNSENISNLIMKPHEDKEIYICGESYSMKQGWIEGSLETAFKVIKMLPLDGFKVVTDKEFESSETKEDTVEKELSLEQVLNEEGWIIMDIDGSKKANVYDVSEWIPTHPGGQIIKEGIKNNNYYKNNKGKSPIELFKQYHSDTVIEKHLINMENPLIKKVGVVLIDK